MKNLLMVLMMTTITAFLLTDNDSVKTEEKGKEKGNEVSTPETAPTKGSDEPATSTPAKGSSKKSTKEKKQDVVMKTITASHGIVSNVIPGLIDTSNQTPSPFAVNHLVKVTIGC